MKDIKSSKNFDLMAERFILSAILEQSDIFNNVQKKITTYEIFYKYEHKLIYGAMLHLFNTENSIDEIMLINALKSQKAYHIELKTLISELSGEVNDISTYDEKINIVLDKWKMRQTERMIERLGKLTKSGHCSFNEVRDIMENYTYLEEATEFQPKNAIQILQNDMKLNDQFMQNGESHRYRGIPTSFASLRKYLVYRRKNITIVAARPAAGKTSYALREAYWQALQGFRVAYFTLEMGESECCTKLICMNERVEYNAFELMPLQDQNDLSKKLEQKLMANKSELIFNDFSFSLLKISSTIKALHKIKPLDIVYIDYVQLVEGDNRIENRNNELSRISRMVKKLSSKYDFAAVVLSQVNRKCEDRENKRPMLSDLRDSGALEQDTSIALALYNGAIYDDPETKENHIELLFLKSRFGPIGMKQLFFESKYMLFRDLVIDPNIIKTEVSKTKAKAKTTPSKFRPNFKTKNSIEARNENKSEGEQLEVL